MRGGVDDTLMTHILILRIINFVAFSGYIGDYFFTALLIKYPE